MRRWPNGLAPRPSELVGQGAKLGDFLAEPAPANLPAACAVTRARPNAQEGRGELMLNSRDGRLIHASISQTVVKSGAGLRTRSVVRDLTPERDWQQALAQSRERFERFFANAPVGIALLDRDGKFVEANPRPLVLVPRHRTGKLDLKDADRLSRRCRARRGEREAGHDLQRLRITRRHCRWRCVCRVANRRRW